MVKRKMEQRVLFSMHLNGPAVKNNSIDAAYLASTLLRIEDLIKMAGEDLYESEFHFSVQVEAFTPGSFIVGLLIDILKETAKQILVEAAERKIKKLIATLFSAGDGASVSMGVIALAKLLQRHTIKNEEDAPDDVDSVIITLDNGETRRVLKSARRLYDSPVFRVMLKTMLSDLLSKGIESISFSIAGIDKRLSIGKKEVQYFRLPEMDEMDILTLCPYGEILWVRPLSVSFKQRYKWYLVNDVYGIIPSTMKDMEFMARVMNGLTISPTDRLCVLLQHKKTPKSQRTTYEVLRVFKHYRGGSK